jgi:hypothetical protein
LAFVQNQTGAEIDTRGIVDARLAAQSIPDFDPAKDGVFDRQMVESMRDQLRTALVRLELREEEVRDLRDRNTHLELEAATPRATAYQRAQGQHRAQATGQALKGK